MNQCWNIIINSSPHFIEISLVFPNVLFLIVTHLYSLDSTISGMRGQQIYQACALSNEKLLVLPSSEKRITLSKKY